MNVTSNNFYRNANGPNNTQLDNPISIMIPKGIVSVLSLGMINTMKDATLIKWIKILKLLPIFNWINWSIDQRLEASLGYFSNSNL